MLKVGIVGLPNAGKSTLFNALIKKQQAAAENYPFCTIEPNTGIVPVADKRLEELAKIIQKTNPSASLRISRPPIIPAVVQFVDIAGLVKNAHKGEGLGNKFLAHIRETSVIVYVLRFFEDQNIVHVSGSVDAVRDLQILEEELIFADLNTLEKQKQPKGKISKEDVYRWQLLQKINSDLNKGIPVRSVSFTPDENKLIQQYNFLSQKPVIYLANLSEVQLKDEKLLKDFKYQPVVKLSAKIESELIDISEQERKELLKSIGIEEPALDQLVKVAYKKLGMISFLTAGEKEVRAWTINKGMSAPQAAGVIHSDFEKNFIKADVVSFEDFVKFNGWLGCRENGLVRFEGKQYQVKEGDVIDFKVGV